MNTEAEVQGAQANDLWLLLLPLIHFCVLLNLEVHYHPGSWFITAETMLTNEGNRERDVAFKLLRGYYTSNGE